MTRLTRGLFICMSSDTSCTSGSRGDRRLEPRRPVVEVLGVVALHGQAVGAVAHPPADLNRRRQRDEGAERRETAAAAARICCAICAALTGRLRRGVSCTLKRAVFIEPNPPPVLAKNVST